jgi:hypothetical protein
MALLSVILLSFFSMLFALEKSCSNCKFYIPTVRNNDLGLCKVFKETPYVDKNVAIHNFAIHCRNNENLCGKDGIFFEPAINYINEFRVDNDIDDDFEIEDIKKEFYEVLRKMKKHNKKRIYKIFRNKE